jgi:hypothetical protein
VNVAVAVTTAGSLVGSVTFAVAVEAAVVPERGVLFAEDNAPNCGVTLTVMTVPTGMLDAWSATVAGFAVVVGSVMSGVLKRPVGWLGADTPLIEPILSDGVTAGKTEPGAA